MNTIELNASTAGDGPPLIMLHGLFGAGDNLGGIRRRLQHAFTVHSLDLRNHGDSPHTDSMTYPEMAADVSAWMAKAGLSSASLLGHSMGGKVAMELALSEPKKVQRLIVADIAPVAYAPHHEGVLEGLLALDGVAVSSRREADKELAAFVQEPRVRQFLLTNMVPGDKGFHWRMNVQALANCYDQIMAAPAASGPFEGPVLFLKGGDSDYIDTSHQKVVKALFPKTQLRVVPGTGHWLHAEKADLFARLCERFLAGDMDTTGQ